MLTATAGDVNRRLQMRLDFRPGHAEELWTRVDGPRRPTAPFQCGDRGFESRWGYLELKPPLASVALETSRRAVALMLLANAR
jgi:hypothetical protein